MENHESLSVIELPFNFAKLGPKSEKFKKLVSPDNNNPLFREQPYLHEKGFIYAFAGFLEREKQGQINQSFLNELIKFFRWVGDLKLKQFPPQERIKGREPLFFGEQIKQTIKLQVEKMTEQNFLEDKKNIRWLKAVLRGYYSAINKTKIFLPTLEAMESEKC